MPIKRLLAVQMADIGDLIVTTPALRALRETFPQAQIDLLTTQHAAPILDGTGLIDNVILFDKFAFDRPADLLRPANLREGWRLALRLRSGHYDAALLFRHLTTFFGLWKYAALVLASGAPIRAGLDNGRGWFLTHRAIDRGFGAQHEAAYWLEVAALTGAKTEDQRLCVGVSEADRQWARDHLPAGKRLIAIHPGSGGYSLARRWEPEKFAVVANRWCEQDNTAAVIVGGPNDSAADVLRSMVHPSINLAGLTTLGQLAAVLSCCSAYVGADSGIMHLAAAASPLAIDSLFGPSNHRAWQPWIGSPTTSAERVRVIRSGVRCSPCSYVGHTVGLRQGCDARTCMKLIRPDDIPALNGSNGKAPEQTSSRAPTLYILGVPVDGPTFASLLDQIGVWIEEKIPRQICTINPEFLMGAQRDVNFYNILNRCDLCIPDGGGLLWAARYLGKPLPERVTGSDGVPLIAERAAREGWRLFLLGAGPGVAEKAAQILTGRYPGLQIAGTYSGSPAAEEEDAIAAMIAASHADILLVAYGAPNQDKWIARNLPRLNVSVAMGVGGTFDFIAGIVKRAPVWMRRAGIEWVYRLIQQPWRARRMTRLPRFVLAVLWRGSRGPAMFSGYGSGGSRLQN